MSEAEDRAFLAARTAVDRGALNRFLQSRGITKDSTEEARTATVAEFRALEPLAIAEVRAISRAALEEARGSIRTGDEPFPATLWLDGASETYDDRAFTGTLRDFVYLLETCAKTVALKRDGLVIEPTTNPRGIRTNEETKAVHALFLDCDANGEWNALLATLNHLNYCYVAYQSGGWSPSTPKWRVVLPLTQAFDTSDEHKRETWKLLYDHCRIVFGSLAELKNVGFDPTTSTPCNPWFLTEKRNATDPERKVVWRAGHSLDLVALAMALPTVSVIEHTYDGHSTVSPITLDDERLEEIVEALSAVTAYVPGGRRDLYLSLPGALLDRGIEPDDVLTIAEAVSSRYPRSHPDKHADNVHCAKTTIGKWERGDRVTRIGTLNDVARHVAQTLDAVLPDPDKVEFFELARRLARRQEEISPPPPPGIEDADTPAWTAPVDLKMLRSFAVKIRRKKAKSEDAKDAVHWILLDRLLKKKTLASPITGDPETRLDREDALYRLMGLLAFRFPKNTPIEVVIELLRPSLFLTLEPGETADKWLKLASRWYLASMAARLEMDAKKAAEVEKERLERIREARECAL